MRPRIPDGVADLIDDVVEGDDAHYNSRNEFVNEAIREKLREMGYYEE